MIKWAFHFLTFEMKRAFHCPDPPKTWAGHQWRLVPLGEGQDFESHLPDPWALSKGKADVCPLGRSCGVAVVVVVAAAVVSRKAKAGH